MSTPRRADSTWHEAADHCLAELAESGQVFALPWPCVHEFLAIVTHRRIYTPPTPLVDALEQVECWMEIPTVLVLGEAPGYWPHLRQVVQTAQVVGPRIHDARLAALCQAHGVRVLWTADRDFSRFAGLRVENPLFGPTGAAS